MHATRLQGATGALFGHACHYMANRRKKTLCQACRLHDSAACMKASTAPTQHAAVVVATAAAQLMAMAQAAVAADAPIVPVDPSTYTPSPMEPSWQVWFGAFVGVVPFVIGAYEFTKRILIQRRCKVCSGSGLVMKGKYPKKCPECGGMFPWVSWQMFLSATATPGNGGPLMQPRGQTSVFYSVPPPPGQEQSSGPAAEEASAASVASTRGSSSGSSGISGVSPDTSSTDAGVVVGRVQPSSTRD